MIDADRRKRERFQKKLASGNAGGKLREALTEYKVLERFNVQDSMSNIGAYTFD